MAWARINIQETGDQWTTDRLIDYFSVSSVLYLSFDLYPRLEKDHMPTKSVLKSTITATSFEMMKSPCWTLAFFPTKSQVFMMKFHFFSMIWQYWTYQVWIINPSMTSDVASWKHLHRQRRLKDFSESVESLSHSPVGARMVGKGRSGCVQARGTKMVLYEIWVLVCYSLQ